MYVDASAAFNISESSQNIDDKFCIVPGFVVGKRFLLIPKKNLSGFQMHFVKFSFLRQDIYNELTNLKMIKNVSFQLLYS